MIQVIVNGSPTQLQQTCTLTTALEELGHDGNFAVAINGNFIPRHDYETLQIKGGELLEVLTPMQGG